ncbi:MAG: hypothetical protein KH192_21120 [Klebsiella aerogenes]|nr:hypothetical protein [Klebsiella aerogenes]
MPPCGAALGRGKA